MFVFQDYRQIITSVFRFKVDADQFNKFLELQKEMFSQLVNQINKPAETV